MKKVSLFFICSLFLISCKSENGENEPLSEEEIAGTETVEEVEEPLNIEIDPISHATAVIDMDGTTVYLDPTGGAAAFENAPAADLVLITDIHGDHLSAETLAALDLDDTKIIAPQAVKEQLPDSLQQHLVVMNNGETIEELGISIEAIPMYNLREEAKQFHPKGRGNGYVLEKNGERLYIAGDTEDIPEMRALENIDVALVPMNLPYTMPVESAADAVVEFAPEKVIPYHFRGTNGMADVDKFKQLVNQGNQEIEVEFLDWYPTVEN